MSEPDRVGKGQYWLGVCLRIYLVSLIEKLVYMYFIFENFQLQSNQVYCGGLHHILLFLCYLFVL